MSIKNSMENQNKISPHYIAGFVDGEGCFGLQFRKDVKHKRPGSPVYYSWKAQFMITARKDERELFEKIKNFLGCGNIYDQKKYNIRQGDEIHYCVSNLDDLNNIISPFFKKYKLQGKKKNDFDLWTEAVDILYRNKKRRADTQKGEKGFSKNPLNEKDFSRLIKIHSEMQTYKAKRPQGLKHINIARDIHHQFHSDPDKKN